MSNAATAAKPSTFAYGSGFGIAPKFYRKAGSSSLFVDDVAVFRSGTFRDSMGYQSTWESMHINQIITNWEHLVNNKLFTDVPVRDGHPGWLISGMEGNGKVIGYHTSLKSERRKAPHDDTEYDYLIAGFEITDPQAQQNIENGTWRNRSAEIGTYTSNAEAEYWPVYMGVAYVDIPAVEGLKFQSPNGARLYAISSDVAFTSKENSVGTDSTQTTPTPPAQQTLPFGDGAQPHVFSINGRQVSDYSAVQSHINALEKFQAETQEQNRRNFVSKLASDNKILASHIEGQTAFALGLTPEQFTAWCGTWDNATAVPAVSNVANTVTNSGNEAQTGEAAKSEEFSILHDVIRAHKMAGTPVAQIKETAGYKKLIAAGQHVEL